MVKLIFCLPGESGLAIGCLLDYNVGTLNEGG